MYLFSLFLTHILTFPKLLTLSPTHTHARARAHNNKQDDNCLYYFKSPKDLSAMGMVLLPSYTITTTSKSENVGNRQFAFKAFNRLQGKARKYIFAAESGEEMKVWMNVMSLACIAFGTGKASMAKVEKKVNLLKSKLRLSLIIFLGGGTFSLLVF